MKLNILIAESRAESRRRIRTILEAQKGWNVCGEAATKAETVETLRALRPDILLLGLALPDKRVRETVAEILQVCPTVRIVILATQDSGELPMMALAAGAGGLVMKSDSEKDFLRAVHDTAKDGRFLSSAAERYIKSYIDKELKILVQKRKNIDRAIADFERLEGKIPGKDYRAWLTADAESEKLIEIKRTLQSEKRRNRL